MIDREKMKARLFEVIGGDMGDQDEHAFVDMTIDHAEEYAAVLLGRNPRMAGYPACDDSEQKAFVHRTAT